MSAYYQDDACTIYHGDCEQVLPTLGPVDIVFTSPPYNLGTSTGGSFPSGKSYGRWSGSALASGYGEFQDAMTVPDYTEWQQRILRLCWARLTETGAIYYNHKPRVQAGVMLSPLSFIPPEIPVRQIIIWARAGGINSAPTHYTGTHEWVVLLAKAAFRLKSKAASAVGDVWRIAQQANTLHPAPFPVSLPLRALETAGPGRVVLDPFMGSGSTLVAAKQVGDKAIGIEIEERYCEIAAKRLAQEVLAL